MQHGYQLIDGNVMAMNGPDASENAIRAAWFAMEHAARFTFIALISFVDHHIPRDRRGDLIKKIQAIGAGCNDLAAKAAARFGTQDPFPGKWRTKAHHE